MRLCGYRRNGTLSHGRDGLFFDRTRFERPRFEFTVNPTLDRLRLHAPRWNGRSCGTNFFLFLCLLLLGFFLRTIGTPILKTLPQSKGEGKACLHPYTGGAKRECRGKIQRNGHHRRGDNIGANQIEVVQQHVAQDPAHQSFNGHSMSPAEMSGQQRQQGRREDQQDGRTQGLGAGR